MGEELKRAIKSPQMWALDCYKASRHEKQPPS